ncbi:MAG TPA: (Fe-S)-binding protein [Gaiellaceae bacterium]|nr:(Fe-S)-binding protein [Gaiellaceae bacterium]
MIERELIDACTHCGFCLPTCPTYGPLWQHESDSPRGRIWLMQGLADGTMTANATVVEHLDRCLGCMACVTACPSGVRYDRLIEQAREVVEQEYERPPGDWLLRALVFAVFPHPRRLRVALALTPPRGVVRGGLRPLVELAPPWRSHEHPPELTPAVGERRGRVGLVTGCVQSVVFGDVNAATARVLAAEGYEVVAPRRQACCGALHLHAGRRVEGRRMARALAERFRDVDAIAVNAAGCGSHLKDAGLDVRVVDVSELLVEPRAERHPLELRVAFQDSCHLLHAQRIREQPRALLDAIPGLLRPEPAEQAICCGSAGIYNLTQPDAARELGDRKAAHVLATGADVYASANPGCLVQVSAALRRAGRPLPALHPIELVDASIRGLSAVDVLASARR